MKLKLISKQTEVTGVETFIFEAEEPLNWKPGQYAHYILPHENPDDRGTERWFTIASAPFEKTAQITTRLTPVQGSSFKRALVDLPIGQTIESDYVDGDFTVEDPEQESVFIAGGIGITPFRSILKEADHNGTKLRATLLYASRDENIVFKDELDAYAKNNPDLKIHYLIAPERLDENSIRAMVPNLQTPVFYLSGPEPMVKSLNETVQNMGVPADHVKLDDFPGYPAE